MNNLDALREARRAQQQEQAREQAAIRFSWLLERLNKDIGPLFDNATAETVDERFRKVCRDWIAQAGKHRGSLIVNGPVGVGKSWLAVAIARACATSGLPTRYYPASKLAVALEDGRRFNAEMPESVLIQRLIDERVLILDDVGAGAGAENDWFRGRLHRLIDARYERAAPTVIVTNLSIDELGGELGLRAVDRLRDDGTLITMTGASRRKGRAS